LEKIILIILSPSSREHSSLFFPAATSHKHVHKKIFIFLFFLMWVGGDMYTGWVGVGGGGGWGVVGGHPKNKKIKKIPPQKNKK
jgi:hypothetical protein